MSNRLSSAFAWMMLVVGIAACLAIAYAAYTLAGYSWAQVVDYKSPYVSQDIPPELRATIPTAAPALSKEVVLVIVDGMTAEVSRGSMPTLQNLRTYGSDVTLVSAQPSLSYPNWTNILTGAPPVISGVTTNWYSGRVLAPTIMDVARQAGRTVVVVGPTDFSQLYGVAPGLGVSLREWPKSGYLSGTLVDDAIRLSQPSPPNLLVLHLPDLDEAGHTYGAASSQYREVAGKVDADIARLVAALQSDSTTFVIVADHGHIATGGHGGWEPEVIETAGVFSGASVKLGTASGTLSQIAPTLSVLVGSRLPAYAASTSLRSVLSTASPKVFAADEAHHTAFDAHYVDVVTGGMSVASAFAKGSAEHGGPDGYSAFVRDQRLAVERNARVRMSLIMVAAAVLICLVIGVVSWRALVAALAGTAAYYALYNLLFFVVHRYLWSLSSFNTETHVKAFMNGRMIEAALSALVGVAVAALVYPTMRIRAHGPRERGYLGGWLALAPATLLVVLGTLAVQVAWFIWYYGAQVTWNMPDFMWAFKYDLDLVQATAVGAAVILAPVVTYFIGRYHPRVRRRSALSAKPQAKPPVAAVAEEPSATS